MNLLKMLKSWQNRINCTFGNIVGDVFRTVINFEFLATRGVGHLTIQCRLIVGHLTIKYCQVVGNLTNFF